MVDEGMYHNPSQYLIKMLRGSGGDCSSTLKMNHYNALISYFMNFNITNGIEINDVDKIHQYIMNNPSDKIKLLRNKEVIQWLFEDFSFLPAIEKKNKTVDTKKYKELEDIWGQTVMKSRRPDLDLDGQWTNKFGEHLCEEIYTLLGKTPGKPVKKEGKQPDIETEDSVVEVKAQTYFTTGTAGEKMMAVPFKYAEIPRLYSKPLSILCIGGAEKLSRELYGNLPGPKCSAEKQWLLNAFKMMRIEYVAATDLLKKLII